MSDPVDHKPGLDAYGVWRLRIGLIRLAVQLITGRPTSHPEWAEPVEKDRQSFLGGIGR